MKKRASASLWPSGALFGLVNGLVLLLIAAAMVLPLIYVIAGSFTSQEELTMRGIVLFPRKPSLDAYRVIFSSRMIFSGLTSSIIITVIGTAINITFTTLMAYPLSKKHLKGRTIIQVLIIFTMVFNAGMIPNYLTIRYLGLIDSWWALWLPVAINPFNLILMRNFFMQIPFEIEESARIDGCNDLQTLLRIVLPLSVPSLAAFSLFYGVAHWNSYFNATMYLNKPEMWPIQVWLRQIIILSQGAFADGVDPNLYSDVPRESVKLAVIVVATLPIMAVYPFLQKYFAKGVLLGSVKG